MIALKQQNVQMRKGLSAVGSVFLIIGILGLVVFGYLIFQTSIVVLIAGVYMK